jgi:hypothetical protein
MSKVEHIGTSEKQSNQSRPTGIGSSGFGELSLQEVRRLHEFSSHKTPSLQQLTLNKEERQDQKELASLGFSQSTIAADILFQREKRQGNHLAAVGDALLLLNDAKVRSSKQLTANVSNDLSWELLESGKDPDIALHAAKISVNAAPDALNEDTLAVNYLAQRNYSEALSHSNQSVRGIDIIKEDRMKGAVLFHRAVAEEHLSEFGQAHQDLQASARLGFQPAPWEKRLQK